MKKDGLVVLAITLFALFGLGALGSMGEDKASDTEKEKKARRLLEVSNAGGLGKQVLNQMLDAFKSQPGLPEGFIAKFKEVARPEELVNLCVPVYTKHLDQADLEAAIAFYESPAGMRFVEKQGLILKECMQLGQKWGQETALKALQSLDEAARAKDAK